VEGTGITRVTRDAAMREGVLVLFARYRAAGPPRSLYGEFPRITGHSVDADENDAMDSKCRYLAPAYASRSV
jgi:hypothetical protein